MAIWRAKFSFVRHIAARVTHHWPDDFFGSCSLFVLDQPVHILHQSNRSESRSVALRTSPCAIESRDVDHEFRLAQTCAGVETAGRVVEGLNQGLSLDVVFDVVLKSSIAIDQLVDEGTHGQGRVASPCVKVVGVDLNY